MDELDKRKIRDNYVVLTQQLIVDEVFMSVLLQERILSDSMKEDIEGNGTKTKSAKASSFLSIILRRGPKAFRGFMKALILSNQDDLAERMDPGMARELSKDLLQGKAADSYQPTNNHTQVPPVQNMQINEDEAFIDVKFPHFPESDFNLQSMLRNSQEIYRMTSIPRGRCIILNNERFDSMSDRNGSAIDVMNISELFKKLHFDVVIHTGKTSQEIRELINVERRHEAHRTANCFVFIVLSHGTMGAIYGTDGLKASGDRAASGTVKIEEVVNQFDAKNCPNLTGKPKIFLFQACQGKAKTKGVLRADGDSPPSTPVEDAVDASPMIPIHEKQDIVVVMSTVPGYISWRNEEQGSWFMRDFVLAMYKHAQQKHFLDIITITTNLISNRSRTEGQKQICELKSGTLTRFLYFFPGWSGPNVNR